MQCSRLRVNMMVAVDRRTGLLRRHGGDGLVDAEVVEVTQLAPPGAPRAPHAHQSQGVPAISAARVGDHNISRLAANCSFQRSMTACASARATLSAVRCFAPTLMS